VAPDLLAQLVDSCGGIGLGRHGRDPGYHRSTRGRGRAMASAAERAWEREEGRPASSPAQALLCHCPHPVSLSATSCACPSRGLFCRHDGSRDERPRSVPARSNCVSARAEVQRDESAPVTLARILGRGRSPGRAPKTAPRDPDPRPGARALLRARVRRTDSPPMTAKSYQPGCAGCKRAQGLDSVQVAF
jgi:hypothetical protein